MMKAKVEESNTVERIKQYSAAGVSAVLAVLCLISGILGLTVAKPAGELVSSTVPSTAILMTRDGVLPLIHSDVNVSVRSQSGAQVVLAYGTTSDVLGWVGDDPYTEVVGIASHTSELKVEEHTGAAGTKAEDAQSGREQMSASEQTQSSNSGREQSQSGSGEAAQSGAAPDLRTSALVEDAASSDMWLEQRTGQGEASLELSDVRAGRSVLAVSSAGSNDLTFTLTWKTASVNILAISSFLLMGVFLILAVIFFFTRRATLTRRAQTAQRLAQREGADITDTQAIDTSQVALLAAEERRRQAETDSDDASDTFVEVEEETEGDILPTAHVEESCDGDELPSKDSGDDEAASNFAQDDSGDVSVADEITDVDDAAEYPQNEDVTVNDDADGTPQIEDEPSDDPSAYTGDSDLQNTQEEETTDTPSRGRHGYQGSPFDEDPPQTVPTDTGIIDLSAIRPGAALPSRRAIREARERGEEKIIIDGHEFSTGLIPVIHENSVPPQEGTSDEGVHGAQSSVMDGASESKRHGGRLFSLFSRKKNR